ncbi:hypothetical protein RG47T_3718 [Mucilaginibacter polytrichastri]|uniref:Uncharacterized protein n=1 Tax=Mucilaginibacter polytrichastri TaxID=1302689 RepID=A0A1Q6A2M0_9SPHI|nr:hypothetical protein RG47T_3718 [Mucilaginibacter polytrichastri]
MLLGCQFFEDIPRVFATRADWLGVYNALGSGITNALPY